ncbi:hypothetical protein Acr_00g0002820 [Actinidia rufa]|uniref:Uncharacterized protein n=1 Tax=Actinidia rufa TaxID=165716 RepID=A0A7J0D8E6_9ERIC|nr:hypothetical protein Acr_00g0002820 [Actinidia rufa]
MTGRLLPFLRKRKKWEYPHPWNQQLVNFSGAIFAIECASGKQRLVHMNQKSEGLASLQSGISAFLTVLSFLLE